MLVVALLIAAAFVITVANFTWEMFTKQRWERAGKRSMDQTIAFAIFVIILRL